MAPPFASPELSTRAARVPSAAPRKLAAAFPQHDLGRASGERVEVDRARSRPAGAGRQAALSRALRRLRVDSRGMDAAGPREDRLRALVDAGVAIASELSLDAL